MHFTIYETRPFKYVTLGRIDNTHIPASDGVELLAYINMRTPHMPRKSASLVTSMHVGMLLTWRKHI